MIIHVPAVVEKTVRPKSSPKTAPVSFKGGPVNFRTINRNLSIAVAASILVIAPQPGRADERGSVHGIVSDASGNAIPGAFVKLKNGGAAFDLHGHQPGRGRFDAKDLPAGSYTVQGVGGALQSDLSGASMSPPVATRKSTSRSPRPAAPTCRRRGRTGCLKPRCPA